ncbi:hypothetical protein SUDANB121_05966 (plasmid) [Nocardiopsis dassonvillei]|uniref:hypothetical protein n=1 Tax=Nocardiopsis dassonvillei TaxID=2014 RepID=UPI003F571BAF
MTALLLFLSGLAVTVLCVRLVTLLPRGGRHEDKAAIARLTTHSTTFGRDL